MEARWMLAAPVAQDDHYETIAGQTLDVGQSTNTGGIELIPARSIWKYLDNGSDQGTAWRAPGFDDSSWNSGPAELGYGDADEATIVGFGPNANAKYITTYFRRQFTIADSGSIQALDVLLNYDDGAVVYLNGAEIARRGMPVGAINFQTLATAAIEDSGVPVSITSLTGGALASVVNGANTIAVEIHQASATSSDISFDLQLNGMIFVVPLPPGVLANDTDADGDSLSAELVASPNHGTLQFAVNGSFTYTPAPNFTGQDTFTYRASDGAAASNVATVTIEVRGTVPENHPPVANPDEYSTPAGEVLRVGGPSDPNMTRALIARGATWRYLDNGTDQGVAWRQLHFNDQSWATGPAELGYGDGDEATVVSFGPNAAEKYITTYFRRHLQIGDPSTLSGVQLGINFDDGIVVYINSQEVVRRNLPAGDIRFNTLANAANEDTNVLEPVAIPGAPGLFRSGDNVVAVEIHQVNPVSSDISFDLELVAMSSDPPPAGVLANDTDADGDALSAILVSPPQQGTLQLASDGSFVYSPSAGFVGEDSFTYRATDGLAASNVATVTITVGEQPSNRPPVARDDAYAVDQGQVFVTRGANTTLSNVPLVQAGAVWKYLDNGSDQGTAWRRPDYDDAAWAQGPAQLGYGDGDEATVVSWGPNVDNKYVTTYFRHRFAIEPDLLASAAVLTLNLLYDDGAAAYLNGTEIVRSRLMPDATYNTLATSASPDDGREFFPFDIEPSLLVAGENVLAVEIHQNFVASADISFDASLVLRTAADRPAGVLENDTDEDGDILTAVLITPPQHGTLAFQPNGAFMYIGDSDFAGVDTFTYQADDGTARSNTATVRIEIGPVTPPVGDLVVSTTVDEADGDHSEGDLSLREAILLANAADNHEFRIVVPQGTYRLSLEGAGEDAAATGDLDIQSGVTNLLIVGAGPDRTIIDAARIDRIFHVHSVNRESNDGGVRIEGMTLTGGFALGNATAGNGGAIANHDRLTLRNVVVEDNEASTEGGGVYTESDLWIEDSRIAGNSAYGGGGVSILGNDFHDDTDVTILRSTLADNETSYSGGGLFGVDATLIVRDSTISGNRSVEHGGGLELWNGMHTYVVNSTISGNFSERTGGGIHNNDDVHDLWVDNSTITANRVGPDGTGGGLATETSTTLRNAIVAGNFRGQDSPTPDDVAGHFLAASRYNLIGVIDGSTGLADVTLHNRYGSLSSGRLDPRLGPLLDNHGPTKTHAILPGSVTLDGGDPNFDPHSFEPALTLDQRGRRRVVDVSCGPNAFCGPIQIVDIGAFELQATDPAPAPGDFNGDRMIDAADIDLLMGVVRRQNGGVPAPAAAAPLASEMSVYDLTGDAVVNRADADYLIETVLETEYGDVDLDGRVGLRDLVLVRNGLGRPLAGWATGDVDGNGAVDRADLALLSANFGYRRGATTLTAPAPVVQHLGSRAVDEVFAGNRPVSRSDSRVLSAMRRSLALRAADAAILRADSGQQSATSRLTATRRRLRADNFV